MERHNGKRLEENEKGICRSQTMLCGICFPVAKEESVGVTNIFGRAATLHNEWNRCKHLL
jgi:hypothetical protein